MEEVDFCYSLEVRPENLELAFRGENLEVISFWPMEGGRPWGRRALKYCTSPYHSSQAPSWTEYHWPPDPTGESHKLQNTFCYNLEVRPENLELAFRGENLEVRV